MLILQPRCLKLIQRQLSNLMMILWQNFRVSSTKHSPIRSCCPSCCCSCWCQLMLVTGMLAGCILSIISNQVCRQVIANLSGIIRRTCRQCVFALPSKHHLRMIALRNQARKTLDGLEAEAEVPEFSIAHWWRRTRVWPLIVVFSVSNDLLLPLWPSRQDHVTETRSGLGEEG